MVKNGRGLAGAGVWAWAVRVALGGAGCGLGGAGVCFGQVEPARMWVHPGGRVEMRVSVPAGLGGEANAPAGAGGEGKAGGSGQGGGAERAGPGGAALELRLFAAPGAEAEARASVMAGRVDLAGMFPVLMDSERAKVRYVQLFVGERAVGAPVVVQPVVAPMKALPTDGRGLGVRFARSGPAYFGGVRMYVLNDVELTTSLGAIRLRLRPDAAPNTAWHFRTLVDQGFYDGTTFHRVVGPSDGATPDSPAGQGYLIQGGDPVGSGVGGPGVAIDLEQSTLAHDFGVVSLARLAEPDSGGSQFFICLSRGMARSLDGAYAAFAEVIEGAEVVRAIGRVKVGDMDRPIKPVVIERARLVEAGAMGGAAKSAGDGRSADRPETPGER